MTSFENILVPTDFSEPAHDAALLAIGLARQFDARITLLHVYELPPSYGYGASLAWPAVEYERLAQRALFGEVEPLNQLYPRVETALFMGSAVERILAAAKDRDIDLIVMGTHGRRGLAHAFLGSVAEKVVRRSHVPVLTVGPRITATAQAGEPSEKPRPRQDAGAAAR